MTRWTIRHVSTFDALRETLDKRNEAGDEPQLAGADSAGRTFVVSLTGDYAAAVHAQIGLAWDSEVSYGGECDECAAQSGSLVTADGGLEYPLTVLVPDREPPGALEETNR